MTPAAAVIQALLVADLVAVALLLGVFGRPGIATARSVAFANALGVSIAIVLQVAGGIVA